MDGWMDGWMKITLMVLVKTCLSSFIDSDLHFLLFKGNAETGSKGCNSGLVATKRFFTLGSQSFFQNRNPPP